MVCMDYEIRTPDKNILLFTFEEDKNGKKTYIAKKGNRQERLTYDKILELLNGPCKIENNIPLNK